tara:strand:+ start:157 stop:819 length:663 start_codon:yes stop_codon:yes gene_type:complete
MKTLLVSATHLELKPFIERAEKVTCISDKLSGYKINGIDFDILCTGVGMVATAFHLGFSLANSNYNRVINVGIAGAFDKSIPLGSVVEIIEDQFPEMGAEDGANFLSLLDLKLIQKDDFPFQSGLLYNQQSIWNLSYPKVKAITVNTGHGSKEKISRTENCFNPQVESMEGAAFFYACKSAKIPCIQIRSISNYVERRNRSSWNIPLAIKNLNAEILNLL